MKILYWDRDGYAIWSKRLAQGRFNIPQSADGKIELDNRELCAILSGIKYFQDVHGWMLTGKPLFLSGNQFLSFFEKSNF